MLTPLAVPQLCVFTGMRCAGCVSRVKVLLEREEAVRAASVNLATETAVVRVLLPESSAAPVAPAAPAAALAAGAAAAPAAGAAAEEGPDLDLEAGVSPHDRQLASMGTSLAQMLTNAGYAATMREQGGGSSASSKVVAAKREERMRRLRCRGATWMELGWAGWRTTLPLCTVCVLRLLAGCFCNRPLLWLPP